MIETIFKVCVYQWGKDVTNVYAKNMRMATDKSTTYRNSTLD